MSDEIIEELWQVKDSLAKQFNYDLDALAAELQRRQKESGRRIVNLAEDARLKTSHSPLATDH